MVLALALPFLSLSFGYVPAKHELDTAAQLVQASADELDGWEISSLVWAAARLGYCPADDVMHALLHQVLIFMSQQTHVSLLVCTCGQGFSIPLYAPLHTWQRHGPDLVLALQQLMMLTNIGKVLLGTHGRMSWRPSCNLLVLLLWSMGSAVLAEP